MANIDKELSQIKNAIYGREVRGSIHDGIDKINKESEQSKAKANEAHDVMENIMNEGFDNAALEANFEQKLDDKIANLQPEWTQFKEDTETQLADIEIHVKFFGANGDGETDDSDAIQEAFNEAERTGSPVSFQKGKRYAITKTINIPPNSSVRLNGAVVFKKEGSSGHFHMFSSTYSENVSIAGGIIDGNRQNVNSSGFCVYFENCKNIFINDLETKNANIGVHFEKCDFGDIYNSSFHTNSSDGLSLDGGCNHFLIERCKAYNHLLEGNSSGEEAGSGFEFDEGSKNIIVRDCLLYDNVIGINCQWHSGSSDYNSDILIDNCFVSNSTKYGIMIVSSENFPGSDNAKVINSTVINSGNIGVLVGGFHNPIIDNNYLKNNGEGKGISGDSIRVTRAKGGSVTGNTIISDDSNERRYPISTDRDSPLYITGSTIKGFEDNAIYGPKSIIVNNMGARSDIIRGTDTILGSRKFVVIEHLNRRTPMPHQINIKFLSDTGNIKNWWLDAGSISPNAFTIRFDDSPGVEVEFMWEIDYSKQ